MSTTAEETKKTTKTELLLDSLEIKGYRCFEHLTIEKLGRVNLIVGKNNVGKTALLEALWIYAKRGKIDLLITLLHSRDEVALFLDKSSRVRVPQTEDFINSFGNLFHGRPRLNLQSNELIKVGSGESYISVITSRLMDQNPDKTPDYSVFKQIWGDVPSGLIIVSNLKENNEENRTEFYSFETLHSYLLENKEDISGVFLKSQMIENQLLARIWDEVVIKGLEEKAKEFLRVIKPNLDYINFVGRLDETANRYPVANSENGNNRVPLKTYGEGMTRLLGISLGFVQCQNGILLIDEIESGLHYSVLPDVWKLIFKTAKDLNVQVFATTHSKDCIEAFAQAAIDDEESDGMLIRLENKDGKIRAVNFNEDELETVERRNIEVR